MAVPNYTAIDELIKKHNEMKYGVGSTSKEADLPGSSVEINEVETQVEQKTPEEEVQEHVTLHSETIKLPPDLKKLGLTSNDDSLFKAALNRIKLPISDDKIMEDLKASPSESKRWFATILMYILERAHLTLKKVGTKVVRIFKTN
jgi:hypothetical protein